MKQDSLPTDAVSELETYKRALATVVDKPRVIRIRSTYNPRNALMFKPFFDAAIASGNDTLIEFALFPRVSPTSLYHKVCDGLLYLQENSLDLSDCTKYTQLKSMIKFKIMHNGINIHFTVDKRGYKDAVTAAAMQQRRSVNWRDAMFAYFDRETTSDEVLSLKDLCLSGSDLEEVRTLAAQHNCLCRCDISYIHLMKK